jgi:probable HAF family extracellular repeat protein
MMARALLLLALMVPSATWGQTYRIVDLGVSDPYFPTALNNRGQVLLTNISLTPARIGLFLASGNNFLPRWSGAASMLWDNGGTSAIGLLPGGTYSRGCGLNDAGQVVGFGDKMTPYSTCLDQPSMTVHAFVWQGGGLADLDPGAEVTGDDGSKCRVFILFSLALGINNQGQVTGWMASPLPTGDYNHGYLHAFRMAGGQLDHEADDLTPGDATITQGWFINNAGAVLGTRLGGGYAFFGGGGGLPPAGGIVYAMNDSGATVGVAGGGAFASGVPGGLPKPFEAALGINNQGQIVGQGTIGDRQHALLYSDGQVIDLEGTLPAGSGWELAQAALINDQGQIVVWGTQGGHSALGLLTPEAPSLTLTLSDREIASDDDATGTVTLSRPAPAGGMAVALAAEAAQPFAAGRLSLPETVQVPEGKTQAQFPLTPRRDLWQSAALFTVSASAGGASQSQDFIVRPTIHGLSLAVDPALGATGGQSVTGTITLSLPAPAGGRAVAVGSSNPAVASVGGAPLVVPAGQQTLDFPIQTAKVTSPATVQITVQTPTSAALDVISVHP